MTVSLAVESHPPDKELMRVLTIYVTGHRNPDMDSIASAMGYAELRGRLDPANEYVAVRLGEINPQARWALERSGAPEPPFLDHVMLRAQDVMSPDHPTANHEASLREVGIAMAKADLDLIPIVDDAGKVVGILTARDLARRYIKESGEPSSFADRPASADLIVDAVGAGATRKAASALAKPGSWIVHIGLQDEAPGLDTRRVTLQEIGLIGTYCYTRADFAAALRLLEDGLIASHDWIEVRPLDDGPQAFADIHTGAAPPKIILATG